MNHLSRSSIKQLVELRDIATAGAELADVMADVAYVSNELTEQQAAAWSTAFRCMNARAVALAEDLLEIEEEDEESAGEELAGGEDAD